MRHQVMAYTAGATLLMGTIESTTAREALNVALQCDTSELECVELSAGSCEKREMFSGEQGPVFVVKQLH